jgi:cellulose synthase/poly-beta-1,6-N-acetylglucosamine synthase-like glycosyltransferase
MDTTLNIIVRTHRRPNYFRKCIESIVNQNYENIRVIVVVDDDESEQYALPLKKEGLIDAVIKVNKADFKSTDFRKLQVAGICKKNRDRDRHFYDLYINKVTSELEEGFCWVVDDDKELAETVTVSKMMKKLESEDQVLLVQHQMAHKTVPSKYFWKKEPLTRGEVDMSCFVWHVSKSSFAQFDGHGAADHRVADSLVKNLTPVWYMLVATVADNSGNHGKAEKDIK